MGEVDKGEVLRRKLKSLCCSTGWSYGVFWCFDQRNPMLLTFKDAYYEEQMATVVDNMLQQVHMLGEGIIGEVAFAGKHKWLFSDACGGECNSFDSIAFQDDSELRCLFSSGIQTIAAISVESRGVAQFGSTQKMLESLEFLDQTKKLLEEMENFDGPIQLEKTPSSLNNETDDLSAIFASLISSGNSFSENLAPKSNGSSRELMENPCSQSSTFVSEIGHGSTASHHIYSSHLCNDLQTAGREAQVLSSDKHNTQYQQVSLQSTSFVKNSVPSTPCISTWSNESSILTSFEQAFPSESVIQDSPNVYSAKANVFVQNFQGESTFTPMYSTEGLLGMEKSTPVSVGKMMDNQQSAQSFLQTEGKLPERETTLPRFPEEFKLVDFATDFSNSYTVNDLSHWFNPSPHHSFKRMGTATDSNLLNSIGSTSVSSGMFHGDVLKDLPIKNHSNSVQSSITDAFISDGQEKFLTVHDVENDLFDGWGQDFGCGRAGEYWEDYIKPLMAGGLSAVSTGMSECITDLDVGSTGVPRRGLFSQLGLEELLNGISRSNSVTRCSFEDQLSTTKRRKIEISSTNSNQVPLTKLSCTDGSISLMQPVNNQDANSLACKKGVLPKSQVGFWIDDSYSINAENAVVAATKPDQKPVKVSRKRARPGESTRPRPKDRQQIQDRLKELRGIIPNGVKCSIDSLLDLTIKHMLFLQSITKYGDKLKEADGPKLIGEEKGVVLKDDISSHNGSAGATWAFEVGGQTMVCPIIVEDLGPPGQMLIEMLCENRGFFLEIADIIRGFGLNIWKGVMEIRENKVWARFIVEANRHVTRMDIFWSLVQLLQQTPTFGTDSVNQPNNAMDVGIPLLDSYQQHLLPVAVSHQLG